jgi:hypothetical protein
MGNVRFLSASYIAAATRSCGLRQAESMVAASNPCSGGLTHPDPALCMLTRAYERLDRVHPSPFTCFRDAHEWLQFVGEPHGLLHVEMLAGVLLS